MKSSDGRKAERLQINGKDISPTVKRGGGNAKSRQRQRCEMQNKKGHG